MPVVEADAGEGGRAYIRARMEGGLSLSRVALRKLDLAAGHVVALVWDTHPNREDFAMGGGERSQACEALRGMLRSFLDDDPEAALWVEEANPRRSDYAPSDLVYEWSRPWFLDQEVYSLVFADDDDDRLHYAINEIWDHPGWGGGAFLTNASQSRRYRGDYELRRESLDGIADATRAIACGAYDGQGFLIWIRD